MGENLKTTQFNDGTPIPTGFATSLDWEIQCGADLPACQVDRAVNANAPGAMQYRNLYGVLYNQFAMKGNIAPQGWHVPSKAELQALVDFVGADARKLKSTAVGKGIGNWLEDTGIEANNLTCLRLCLLIRLMAVMAVPEPRKQQGNGGRRKRVIASGCPTNLIL